MSDQPKRRVGRPALPAGEGKERVIKARVPLDLAEKFRRLGGSAWLRQAITKAREG